ncbi:MAG: Gfo/Idh/MocA family protein [Gemmataceae bacterium]
MEKGNLSRRGFMERSLTGMVGVGLPLWYAREILESQVRAADEPKKNVSPNDKIRIGLVGCGGQGRGVMRWAKSHKEVEVAAICDVDRNRREECLAKDLGGSSEVKMYEDFRELCDRKDLNAVIVGTPDHWHTLVAIDAMKKGKDVYCEKPLTLTIAEGKALVKVAQETKAIFQVGSQQRSDARFRLACELVRNGRVGKIKTIETRIGDNPQGGPFKEEPVPEGLNWDFWLGQTPKVPYIKQRCHYEFRWWYEYSGGKMTDWGAHHNDIAQWALGMDDSGPIEVESLGTEPSRDPSSYNCHQRFTVTYTYANGAKVLCSDRQLPNSREPRHDNGILIVGENNQWIFVNRGLIEASDQDVRPVQGKKSKGIPGKAGGISKLLEEPLSKDATRLYVSTSHMGNFLEGIKTRKKCICNEVVGHRSVSVCHLGVISLRLGGKRFGWDPNSEMSNVAEVNNMLSRPIRSPWKLEA